MTEPTRSVRTPTVHAILRRGLHWPALVTLLFLGNMALAAWIITVSSGDASFGVERDYYDKALNWNDEIDQRSRNAALAWSVTLAAPPRLDDAGRAEILLRVADRGAAPITGAAVAIEAFPIARPAESRTLAADEIEPGLYAVRLDPARRGLWQLRLRVTRDRDTFTARLGTTIGPAEQSVDLIPLITTVFLASLCGSLHCAGMCGAFVLFAIGGPARPGVRSRTALHAAYHAGRLTTYTILGALAGLLGAAFDLGGSLLGVQRVAAILAGAVMVVFGSIAILRIRGVRIPKPPTPALLERLLTQGRRAAASRPPIVRALATGLLTTLLPCGWLYAFVISAAGTGSAAVGALAMAAFWLGTLPMLVAVGAGLRAITGPLGRRLPAITAAAVVVVGLATIVVRSSAIRAGHHAGADADVCITLPAAHTEVAAP